jgi:hypothetical protein
MKTLTKKIFITSVIISVIALFTISLSPFPDGYTGTTMKNGGSKGCICHGEHMPTSKVTVRITGPDSVPVGQTRNFQVRLIGGPAIRGGFNVAVSQGIIDTVASDTSAWRKAFDGELTHRYPKQFQSDTCRWTFKYTAPNTTQIDTLFATANSVNFDNTSDSDKYNFSPNKLVRVYIPIGIKPISTIAEKFSLGQNYPNPFNPNTKIRFVIPPSPLRRGAGGEVNLTVFDILGREVITLVNENLQPGTYEVNFNGTNLTTGIYFYSLFIGGQRFDTKKMVMIK